MERTSLVRAREAGGVTLTVILLVLLGVAGYFTYKGIVFYRANIAPAVSEVSKVVGVVKDLVPSYKMKRDPVEVAQALRASFQMAPPEGYVGAFALSLEFLGKRPAQIIALTPQGVPVSEIFEGGRNEIRFSPGKHTIFIAAQFDNGDRDEMREEIGKMVAGGSSADAQKPVFIAAGGRRVAAYRGVVEAYGARNTVVTVLLDEGRIFHATGPAEGFDEAALVRALDGLVTTHPANALLYSHPKPEAVATAPANTTAVAAVAPTQDDPCGIRGLKGDFDVVMVSVSRGSQPIDALIEKGGREAAREEVMVGETPKPVVLILSGESPVVWSVGRTSGARIAGVLAQGVYRQAVIGLPKSIPVVAYSTSDGPNACTYFRADKAETPEYRAMNHRVRTLFGRDVSVFLTRKAGPAFVVGDIKGDVAYAPDVTLASVTLPDSVTPSGKRGLDRLEKQKAIRLATDEDIAAWVRGAATRLGRPFDAYRRDMDWRLRNGSVYVVLGDFDLPDDLAGANARTFILPAGKSRPGGPQGHCTFLAMEGFQCYGVGCR